MSQDAGDRASLHLWLRLLACSTEVEKIVRARLAAGFATTLPRFDVLAALERAPDGLRLSALSRSLRVSNGNVTGIVARLVAEGLIHRRADPTDGRVFLVSLTNAGRSGVLKMAAAHETWIGDLFGGLAPADRTSLLSLLGRLRRSLAERKAEV